MKDKLQASPMIEETFTAEVSDPYYSPTITKGLIELKVHHTNRGILRHDAAQLIGSAGEVYPVTVRAHGRLQPNLSMAQSWKPGDFLIRVDGITFEQAQQVRRITQGPNRGSDTFRGEIIETIQLEEGLISVRVRPMPYKGIHRGPAELLNKGNQSVPVTLQRILPAPPSPILGRFGDLICIVAGTSFEQIKSMRTLIQIQKK